MEIVPSYGNDLNLNNFNDIDKIYLLYHDNLLNLARHIIKKNLYYLSFQIEDLELEILHAIKQMAKVPEDSIKKYSYYGILKKHFVRNLICLNRHYLTNKQKVLTLSLNEGDCDIANLHKCHDNPSDYFNNHYDYEVVMNHLNEHLKNKDTYKIFEMYLQGKKVKDIKKFINLSSKQIYNCIANVKNYLNKEYKNKFF